LQIADLGLAAFHKDNTRIRRQGAIQTMTPSGTRRYEPPETNEHRQSHEPRSRAYDIWSMGCILVELLIWLTYGNDAVVAFGTRTPDFFWQIKNGIYVIHDVVQECMEALEILFQGHPAHAAVLKLVRQKLLVVHGQSTTAGRLTADKVHEEMDRILTKCRGEAHYHVTFKGKLPLPAFLSNKDTRPVLHTRDGALAVADQNERPAKLPANKQDLQFDNVKLDRQATVPFEASNNSLEVETTGEQEQYVGSSHSLIPRVNGTN
jgi:serine/threonine protein kinase